MPLLSSGERKPVRMPSWLGSSCAIARMGTASSEGVAEDRTLFRKLFTALKGVSEDRGRERKK